jgi:hypothetical protein
MPIKLEESCCWMCTLEHVFGKTGSTFVTTKAPNLERRVKVLALSSEHRSKMQNFETQRKGVGRGIKDM